MQPSATLAVRPELVLATLRLFDGEAEHFSHDSDPTIQEVADSFASMAASVRAGEPIDITPGNINAGTEVVLAVRHALSRVSQDGGEFQDWRYLSGIVALAADVEDISRRPRKPV